MSSVEPFLLLTRSGEIFVGDIGYDSPPENCLICLLQKKNGHKYFLIIKDDKKITIVINGSYRI